MTLRIAGRRSANAPLFDPEEKHTQVGDRDDQAEKTGRFRRAGANASELAEGMFLDGPAHTAHAIKANPKRFVKMLGTMAAVGTGAHMAGIDPELIMIPTSLGSLGYQMRAAAGTVRDAVGPERWRKVGSEVLWPVGMSGAFFGGGAALMDGAHVDHPATGVVDAASTSAEAGASSVLIAGDAPLVFNTALDKEPPPDHHPHPIKHLENDLHALEDHVKHFEDELKLRKKKRRPAGPPPSRAMATNEAMG